MKFYCGFFSPLFTFVHIFPNIGFRLLRILQRYLKNSIVEICLDCFKASFSTVKYFVEDRVLAIQAIFSHSTFHERHLETFGRNGKI